MDYASPEQKRLPLLGRLTGASVAPHELVKQCKTYREAVRMCWALRRVQRMTQQQLATEGEFYAQHVGDWLNRDDKKHRRDLPGDCIGRFQALAGNTLVTQWLAAQDSLTVLEEVQADRAA